MFNLKNWSWPNPNFPYNRSMMKNKMTTERAEKLDKLMQNVFDAIEEYQETLKKSDIKWAERYLESENAEDNGDLEETAYGITGFGENLIDTGKSFCNDSND